MGVDMSIEYKPSLFTATIENDLNLEILDSFELDDERVECERQMEKIVGIHNFFTEVLHLKSTGDKIILVSFADETTTDHLKVPLIWRDYKVYYDFVQVEACCLNPSMQIRNEEKTL